MSKYVIDSSTLTSIADAVRTKGGTTDPIVVSDIPTAITNLPSGGGGDIPEEAFLISGNCRYRFAYDGWNWFLNKYGNKISTKDITNGGSMFCYSYNLKSIPFELNFDNNSNDIGYMFEDCHNLTQLKTIKNPKVKSASSMFKGCNNLRNIPEDFAATWDWSYLESQTSGYTGSQNNMFDSCYSLRSIPMNIIKSGNPYAEYNYSYFYYGFNKCYALDELINLPIPYTKSEWSNIAFYYAFSECNRVKNVTFATQEDGSPIVVKWYRQLIQFDGVGYGHNKSNILNYNSGITADKEVTDDASYQLLKNDPDWFTTNSRYSRYNHDSAVRTINSLPDTSSGSSNNIRFFGIAGELTDGGAINTLTEEEIAVAAAKGWTVTIA